MSDWVDGLPPAAHERVARQRASGVAGSLLSAPAAASVRSAGLAPVGEVFGCLVMNLGWAGAGCGWWGPMGPRGGFGAPGSGSASFGSAVFGGPASVLGASAISPVMTSGNGGRYGSMSPYTRAYEAGWYGAVNRMLTEARALDAHGVVGVRVARTHLANSAYEFSALGTAVRSVDPLIVPFPTARGEVWHTDLSAEDCAAAILSGYLPTQMVLGISVSTKHEDWQLQQQRTSWVNGEVSGMSQLIQAARNESRVRLASHATHTGGAELIVTGMTLAEFETPCSGQDGRDLHAESVIVGTTVVPIPRFTRRRTAANVLSVLPLSDERKHG